MLPSYLDFFDYRAGFIRTGWFSVIGLSVAFSSGNRPHLEVRLSPSLPQGSHGYLIAPECLRLPRFVRATAGSTAREGSELIVSVALACLGFRAALVH